MTQHQAYYLNFMKNFWEKEKLEDKTYFKLYASHAIRPMIYAPTKAYKGEKNYTIRT